MCIRDSSEGYPLSYLDNDGGVSGSGGFLVIFNWPNRPIFINQNGARLSVESAFEMPPARLGATAGLRAFVATGDNIVSAGDPFGGAEPLAPLTFREMLDPGTEDSNPGDFFGQTFTLGSILNNEQITAICRLPKFGGPSQDFFCLLYTSPSPRDS